MAVALVITPDLYALTKGGRMRYVFTGSGRVVTAGSFAVNAINFPGLPVPDGTRFVLRWNGHVEEIVARTNPTAVNEIPAGNGGEAYVASLLPYFKEYYPFREDFTVSLDSIGGSHSLIFEANKPGPAYNFSPADAKPNVANIDPRFAGGAPIVRDRYSIYVELFLQKPGTAGLTPVDFARVGAGSTIATDDDGVAEFDAGELLHAHLERFPDWPHWSNANATDALHSTRRFYIAYGEAWGNPIRVGRITTDTIRHAYLGGADYIHRASTGFSLPAFSVGINPSEDKALRLGRATRYVRPDEPQFLTFLNTRATASAVLRIRLIFDDNTGATITNRVDLFVFEKGSKWTVPAGVTQLDLLPAVPVGRTLKEYRVRLLTAGADPNGNAFLSAEYRYILNVSYQPYTRYFAYLNSLGCVDTLATFGKGSYELVRFYEQAQVALAGQYEVADGQFVEYDLTVQQQVEVATGFRAKAELQSWNDFYRSPARLLIQLKAGGVTLPLPIGIVSKSIKQSKDGDTLFAHKFEYVPLYRDEFYSVPDPEEEAGDGLPPPGFVAGGGTIEVSQPMLVRSVDDTISAAVRALTAGDIARFKISAARPDSESLGYLRQAAADALYFRQDQGIDYQNLTGTPTTRDQAGLTDVPTIDEVASLTIVPSLDKVVTEGGAVTNKPIKTDGYGRFHFTPVSNPHGMAVISKSGEDDYYIEEADAAASRWFLSVPRYELETIQTGQTFAARRNANGTVEMVPVNRDNLQTIGERGSEYRGPIAADVLQMFQELPPTQYASHLVSVYYNTDIRRWVFVKIATNKLASDLIGLLPGKALADRVLEFLPEIAQSRILVIIDDIRCETVTVADEPAVIYSRYITAAMLGVAQPHTLGVAGAYINPILTGLDNRPALDRMTLVFSSTAPFTYTLTADDGSTDFEGKLTLYKLPTP